MTLNLIELAKKCPNLQIVITLGDLIEANSILIAEAKRELEQIIADEKAETYLSRDKVKEILEISESTLWRWQKAGYLNPISIGGKRRYRKSDVKRILDG